MPLIRCTAYIAAMLLSATLLAGCTHQPAREQQPDDSPMDTACPPSAYGQDSRSYTSIDTRPERQPDGTFAPGWQCQR